MPKLTSGEILFIGLSLEGFFYGLYSGIFAMYFQIQASKKDSNKMQNVIFYSICALYVLSAAIFVCDITAIIYAFLGKSRLDSFLHIDFVQTTSFACSDFIAQFVLIYRCWIVWGCKFRVVIIPTLLAFAFLGTWLAGGGSQYILLNRIVTPRWGYFMALTSLTLSLTVNALVTGLIVFRIFKVFRKVKATSDDQILGATGGNKLRRVILVLIESGMALFAIQLARLVVSWLETDMADKEALVIFSSIHEMLTGITPTIILVRTSLGLSFHDEKSMEEVVIGSLRFAEPNRLNSVPEIESVGMVVQDNNDDNIDVQRSNDIDVVDR